jgi:hypothetical protein
MRRTKYKVKNNKLLRKDYPLESRNVCNCRMGEVQDDSGKLKE